MLAHSVVAVAAAELAPLADLPAACRSALELHLEPALMSVLVLAREPEVEPGPETEPETETEVEVEVEVAARRICVILASALMDVPLHQLSHFDLDFVPPCTEPSYFASHRSVGLSFVGGMADVIVEPGLAEAALAKAGEQVARGVENC